MVQILHLMILPISMKLLKQFIPATNTPGAKAAKVGAFMTVMVKDCYDEKDQKIFREGMDKINAAADKKFDKSFMELSADQRHELLVALDNEQKEYGKNKKKDDPNHYFRLMKELTLLGYFTSEIGCQSGAALC